MRAALRPVERFRRRRRTFRSAASRWRGLVCFLAGWQSLRTSRCASTPQTRRADEVRLDAEVEQTRDRARRIVRVQRAEHQVAGERRLRRELGGFRVADFADHHDVRVLPQQRPQRVGESEAGLLVHLKLVDARQVYSTGSSTVQMFTSSRFSSCEHRVERRALAAAGRAGDEQDAVGQRDQLAPLLERLVAEAELLEVDAEPCRYR